MGEKSVAVIMVGGPTTSTRFRPLTLDVPAPLFPVAGRPMVWHPIRACQQVPGLTQIFVIGFFEEKEFAPFVSSISSDLRVPVKYLREEKSHGSAGSLYHFRTTILQDSPANVFVINCDVCSSFPLVSMLDFHKKVAAMGTMLTKKVAPDVASDFGELVSDEGTHEVLHYAEKPETFVSDRINCGVYLFTPEVIDIIKASLASRADGELYVRMDEDVLAPCSGKKKLYAFEQPGAFWEQIKSPGLSLRSSALYLANYRQVSPDVLAASTEGSATTVGDVYIHPSAKVHPSAKIGPNVSVSASARIGAGARLKDCIILEDVEVKDNAIISNAIIGWKSVIGQWARVQGSGDITSKLGTTILGEDVSVASESVIINCIVLPHKSLKASVQGEIIL